MSNRRWIAIFVIVALLLAAWLLLRSTEGDKIGIWQDGELKHVIDLHEVTEPYDIILYYEGGRSIVRVARDTVWVVRADCPTHECEKHGSLDKTHGPIVCLPHNIIISWLSDSNEADAISR